MGPGRDLSLRLLAGDQQAGPPRRREAGDQVQEQGGLADAGLARQQRHGARHQTAAEHPVDAVVTGGDPLIGLGGSAGADQRDRGRRGGSARAGDGYLLERAPGAATGAAPGPLGAG